jgi:hypothetical protein
MLSRLLRPIGTRSAVEDLPIPPVFGRCSHTLAHADEAAASSIYWQIINRSHPLASAEAALELLDVAIAQNPWVGEPHALKAQIALSQGDFELAASHSNHASSCSALGELLGTRGLPGRDGSPGAVFSLRAQLDAAGRNTSCG